MRIYFYIDVSDLEYLNKILLDSNNINETPITIFNKPTNKGSFMVSVPYDEYVKLNDIGLFVGLISL